MLFNSLGLRKNLKKGGRTLVKKVSILNVGLLPEISVINPGTVWKFQDFVSLRILHEINFEEYKRAKCAVFTILGAVN